MFHKRSWFPIVVIVLSLALATVVISSFLSKEKMRTSEEESLIVTVSDVAYQKELASIVKPFVASSENAKDDATRSALVQTMLDRLLHMRVPAKEKDLHLELALSLQQMKEGLSNHSKDADDGFVRFKTIVAQTSWLNL